MEERKPLVSIYCLAYNHEKYLRDCLDGLLMQKTDFPFEIIVHDDASTDKTADIISEYQIKHPDIIKAIYQKENKHSQRINVVAGYVYPILRGEFIAICEGDDYWTDPEKLQLQINAMREHPECHFCVAGVEEVALDKTPLGYFHPNTKINGEVIPSKEFIEYAGKYAFQTTSYIMRYEDWKGYICDPPEFRKASDMGDITMMLYFGNIGPVAYVDRVMSCYRRGAPASFSADRAAWSEARRINHFERQLKVWTQYDEYSNGRYHAVCVKKVSDLMFGYYILLKDAKTLVSKENREYFDLYSFPKKTYVYLACVFKETIKKQYIRVMQGRDRKQLSRWKSV